MKPTPKTKRLKALRTLIQQAYLSENYTLAEFDRHSRTLAKRRIRAAEKALTELI